MRHLIVCCDGTWNTAEQEDSGVPVPTNVRKFFNALSETSLRDEPQLKYYHPGVGAEGSLWSRLAGGVFGKGINSNIKSGYAWLARNYQAGDQVYLIGFSRGAFTVRSIAGVLGTCGLLDATRVAEEHFWAGIDRVYDDGYRKGEAHSLDDLPFHRTKGISLGIRFVGVWDTVGALGIPDDLEIMNLFDNPRKWEFHDVTLGQHVEVARHAVAMDEQRSSFTPTLWKSVGHETDLKQLWFPGVHSDVGGGYKETGLSDGALMWMIEEAATTGLAFNAWMMGDIRPDYAGTLHDSGSGLFRLMRARPRGVPMVSEASPEFHPSARERHARPPLNQAPYRPTRMLDVGERTEVDIFARERWNDTGVFLVPGTYRFEAAGEWLDSRIKAGPDGSRDERFHIGEVVRAVSSVFGRAETLWRNITDNDSTDFIGTRRVESEDWMKLIGSVAVCNADDVPADGAPAPLEPIAIGCGTVVAVTAPGYLYAFANDAWASYENNRGSVRLTMSRIS